MSHATSSRRQFWAKKAAKLLANMPEGEAYGVDTVISGTVDLTTYQDHESGYVVFRVAPGSAQRRPHRRGRCNCQPSTPDRSGSERVGSNCLYRPYQ